MSARSVQTQGRGVRGMAARPCPRCARSGGRRSGPSWRCCWSAAAWHCSRRAREPKLRRLAAGAREARAEPRKPPPSASPAPGSKTPTHTPSPSGSPTVSSSAAGGRPPKWVRSARPRSSRPRILEAGRWVLTVSCDLRDARTVYLAVPIVRHGAGEAAVIGAPSIVAVPATAGADPERPPADRRAGRRGDRRTGRQVPAGLPVGREHEGALLPAGSRLCRGAAGRSARTRLHR